MAAFKQDTFFNLLSIDHRNLFYKAYIKPQIEHCSVVRDNKSTSSINKINKLQRRAFKLILSQEYNGLEESLKRLDILSFDQSVFEPLQKLRTRLSP